MAIYILGINSAFHESSAAILENGKLLAAAEEERFTRVKHAKNARIDNPEELPVNAIAYCLKEAGIKLREVDYIGFSFNPEKRLNNTGVEEQVKEGDWGSRSGELTFHSKILEVPKLLSRLAGQDLSGRFHWLEHHLCHASSAFFASPFEEAAVLSMDGIGELATTWLGSGEKNKIRPLREICYPNSIGFLWEKFARFLGFTGYDSGKVMGLAPYGNWKRHYPEFRELVKIGKDGTFAIDNNILKFRSDDFKPVEDLFGVSKIDNPSDRTTEHEDLAAALQKITDETVLGLVKYLSERSGSANLCLAGGVALNSKTNSEILFSGLFKNVYIQPAAHDAGTALGAAYHLWCHSLGGRRTAAMRSPYVGPEYSDKDVENALKESGLNYRKGGGMEKTAARLLADGNIVGWFRGRLEWGPRALGNRSILADPRDGKMRDLINDRIKHRESFRPFAPSVLAEDAGDWFKMSEAKSASSGFMLFAFDAKREKRGLIPAVVHVDGTSRIQIVTRSQNPKFYGLLSEFKNLTGIPMVLNTSFNASGEPIVCTPKDAIAMFEQSEMDFLAIGDYLVTKGGRKLWKKEH